ncbi:PspC domain-containing protein [Weissella halotolerans]|uniref:PspC domain-containing protein n=1 Tax=Weissella halotolerans TaxID=1615 RepID=UPI0003B55812|nr:PspC domain-containing protein [Weissella halotolerans]
MKKHLYKSSDRVLAGVLGGIANYFNLDPTLVRLLFALATVFCFPLVFFYIIAAIVVPSEPSYEDRHYVNDDDNDNNEL